MMSISTIKKEERFWLWRRFLDTKTEAIVRDLDVKSILPQLRSCGLFNNSDLDRISLSNDREEAVDSLLKLVRNSNLQGFNKFRHSLKLEYDWLASQLSQISLPDDKITEFFEKALRSGGIPSLPHNYIKRQQLETQLVDALNTLKFNEVLAVVGMAGSGKSSLVSSALRNSPFLVIDAFVEKIFWIDAADCTTKDKVCLLKSRVYAKLRGRNNLTLPIGQDDYPHLLENFTSPELSESLIVVDNLQSSMALEPFLLGCKVLVTTTDTSLVSDVKKKIHVQPYLELYESLELFAKSVGQDVALPKFAYKIHQHYKGHPLLMALTGSTLASNAKILKDDPKRWADYIPSKRFKNILKTDTYTPIVMCIRTMEKDLIDAYMKLAVLRDDAKVSASALEVIMDVTESDAEKLVLAFLSRNLLIKHYDERLKAFEYEVHDLILKYLKSVVTNGNLNIALVERYRNQSVNFTFLPEDGYFCDNICFHMRAAGESCDFLFSDLNFIGSKIRLSGHASFLEDMNKYCNKTNAAEEFIDDLKIFLELNGHDLYTYQDTEIVQHILQYGKPDSLFKKALSAAKSEQNRHSLYLDFPHDNVTEKYWKNCFVNDLKENICTVRFYRSEGILIGLKNGDIIRLDMDFKKVKVFERKSGHNKPILFIAVSSTRPYKMATARTNSVHLNIWTIEDDEKDSTNMSEMERRYGYRTIVSRNGSYEGAIWGRRSRTLLTYAGDRVKDEGAVLLYDENDCIRSAIYGKWITAVAVSLDETFVFTGTNHEESPCIKMYNVASGNSKLVTTIRQSFPVVSLFILSDAPKTLYALTDKTVLKYAWEKEKGLQQEKIFTDPSATGRLCTGSPAEDGSVLFVSTADFHILVFCLKTFSVITKWNNQRGIVKFIDTCIFEFENVNNHMVVSGSQLAPNSVKLWLYLPSAPYREQTVSKLTMKFDCVFDEKSRRRRSESPSASSRSRAVLPGKDLPDRLMFFKESSEHVLTAAVDTENRIQVLCGKTSLAASTEEETEITGIALSACGLFVTYGLKDGCVKRFHWKSKRTEVLKTFGRPVDYLKTLDGRTVVTAGDRNLAVCWPPLAPEDYEMDNFPSSWESEDETSADGDEPSSVVECFHLGNDSILSVSRDGSIKLWSRDSNVSTVLSKRQNSTVKCAAMQNDSILAVCDASGVFLIYKMNVEEGAVDLQEPFSDWVYNSPMPITSCCISADSKILAMGLKSGEIMLWDIHSWGLFFTLPTLDECPVTRLMFSPVPPQTPGDESAPLTLVSLSAHVQWWNVSDVLQRNPRNDGKSKVKLLMSHSLNCSMSEESSASPRAEEPLTFPLNRWEEVWKGKRYKIGTTQENLLSCVKLTGMKADDMRIDKDFTTFVTVDGSKNFYIMNVLEANASVAVWSSANVKRKNFTTEQAVLCENGGLA